MNEMNPSLQATIEWVAAEAGGRKAQPPGPTYMAPARFGPCTGNLPEEANFTLIAELVTQSDAFHWEASVRFLVAEAPHQVLQPGATFEFYEGRRCVAKGTLGKAVQ